MFLENVEGMTYIMALSPKYFSMNVVKIGIFSYITAEKSSNFVIFNIAAMLLLYIPSLSTDPLTSFMAFLSSSTGSSLGPGIRLIVMSLDLEQVLSISLPLVIRNI